MVYWTVLHAFIFGTGIFVIKNETLTKSRLKIILKFDNNELF